MASLSQAKSLGGVGSILIVLTIAPVIGPVLGIVGFVLLLLAVKQISDLSQQDAIFNDMIIATVLAIIGVVAGAVVFFATFFPRIPGILSGNPTSNFLQGDVIAVFTAVAAGLAVIWVSLVLSAVFLRRSYAKTSSFLKIGLFDTAALLYLIGAALTIVLVGFVLILIAEVVQAAAFFSIPDRMPITPESGMPAASPN